MYKLLFQGKDEKFKGLTTVELFVIAKPGGKYTAYVKETVTYRKVPYYESTSPRVDGETVKDAAATALMDYFKIL